MILSPSQRRQRGRRGNVLIEFALCGSLLITFFAVIFQLGYACYQYNQLANGVRAGARFASMQKISNGGNGVLNDAYINEVRNVVVYGTRTPSDASTPIVPGLKVANVEIIVGWDAKFTPKTVEVRIKNFTIDALFTKFTIPDKPRLQMPFLGLYSPVNS
jgi:hypothetical protein